MTLFNKKVIKKLTAAMAIVSLLTPTVFAQTAPPPPQQIPTIVVNGQTVPAGGSGYTLGAVLGGLFDTTAAEAAVLAQAQTDNFVDPIPGGNYAGVVQAEGADNRDPVVAARAAANNGIPVGKYFSFCNPGDCVKWLRNTITTVRSCDSSCV